MSSKRDRESGRRMLGPGVVRRRRGRGGDELVLTPEGVGKPGAPGRSNTATSPAELDTDIPIVGESPRRRVSQLEVGAGSSVSHDVVLRAAANEPVRWNCFARGLRGKRWYAVEPDSGGGYSVTLLGAELRVRGAEASAAGAEPGEIAWRFSLRNVPRPRERDLLVRCVLELGARSTRSPGR